MAQGTGLPIPKSGEVVAMPVNHAGECPILGAFQTTFARSEHFSVWTHNGPRPR
jgi:hypothetical protein